MTKDQLIALVIEGDGVDPDDRADWEAIYGDDDEDDGDEA